MRWVRGGGAASQRTVNYSVFSLEGNTVDLIWNLNLISNVLLCYKNNNKVKQQNKAIQKKKSHPCAHFAMMTHAKTYTQKVKTIPVSALQLMSLRSQQFYYLPTLCMYYMFLKRIVTSCLWHYSLWPKS